jgi:hypothetical protein
MNYFPMNNFVSQVHEAVDRRCFGPWWTHGRRSGRGSPELSPNEIAGPSCSPRMHNVGSRLPKAVEHQRGLSEGDGRGNRTHGEWHKKSC